VTKFAGFDLETSGEAPRTDSWDPEHPLGITCAAVVTSDKKAKVWHGKAPEDENERLPDTMTPEEVVDMISALWKLCSELGYILLTWNGAAFDFRVLAMATEDRMAQNRCRVMAKNHIDMFFAMYCSKGFGVGLKAAGLGQGLGGKYQNMDGAVAVGWWQRERKEQSQVLKYVARDAQMTLQVYQAVMKRGYLAWTARSGRKNTWVPDLHDGQMLTPNQALELPAVDTGWMDTPPKARESFLAWTLPLEERPEEAVEDIDYEPATLTLNLHVLPDRLAAYIYAHLIASQELQRSKEILQLLEGEPVRFQI